MSSIIATLLTPPRPLADLQNMVCGCPMDEACLGCGARVHDSECETLAPIVEVITWVSGAGIVEPFCSRLCLFRYATKLDAGQVPAEMPALVSGENDESEGVDSSGGPA